MCIHVYDIQCSTKIIIIIIIIIIITIITIITIILIIIDLYRHADFPLRIYSK